RTERLEKASYTYTGPSVRATPTHRVDHRDHGTRRLVSRRAAAGEGLRGRGRGAPYLARFLRAHRTPARPRAHRARGPAGPALPHDRGTRREAGRDLQSGGSKLRPHVLDPAGADGRVYGARGHAPARGRAPRAPSGARLPGELVRDVREGAGDAAARDDAILSPLPLWRRQGVRPPDYRELPRVLRAVRRQRHPLQS